MATVEFQPGDKVRLKLSLDIEENGNFNAGVVSTVTERRGSSIYGKYVMVADPDPVEWPLGWAYSDDALELAEPVVDLTLPAWLL